MNEFKQRMHQSKELMDKYNAKQHKFNKLSRPEQREFKRLKAIRKAKEREELANG